MLSHKFIQLVATSRQSWALARPYFYSDQKWRARALLVSIIGLNLALVYMALLFNNWNKLFYDALQEKNADVFWAQLGHFTYLACAFIVIAVYKFYLTQLLELRWRAWMTAHYLSRWLSNQTFYRLELGRLRPGPANHPDNPDNPDQRIQEDIQQFTATTLALSMGLLNAVVTLVSFVGILWSLSGDFVFHVAGTEYTIAGFMVWVALLYCLAGSVITHYLGRRQIGLNFQQQRFEADFRHHMVRVREYSESIALERGETAERNQLEQRFGRVLGNYLALIRAQKSLIWFTSFFGQAAVVFPFLVAAPRFLSGAIQLGELMQIASAFGQVQGALSWFVDSYNSLAGWRATTDRLTSFEASISALEHDQKALTTTDSLAIEVTRLKLGLPDGAVLLEPTDLTVQAGQRILLQGPSGAGKSTLLRALAGIWPFASGRVSRPVDCVFMPQRAYFPNGPLRDALAYPQPATRFDDAQLRDALAKAQLATLSNRLDEVAAWNQTLSGGEQQRLAIARVWLKKPRWIFADEATSNLDEKTENAAYKTLLELVECANGALVSIAHKSQLTAFHTHQWVFQQAPENGTARFTLQSGCLP